MCVNVTGRIQSRVTRSTVSVYARQASLATIALIDVILVNGDLAVNISVIVGDILATVLLENASARPALLVPTATHNVTVSTTVQVAVTCVIARMVVSVTQ